MPLTKYYYQHHKVSEMIISVGRKHLGDPAELVVLTDPCYVEYLLTDENTEAQMPGLKAELRRLIDIFDRKKLSCSCRCCGRPVRCLAFYRESFFYETWCAECTPEWLIRDEWRMDKFYNYLSAVDFGIYFCHSDKYTIRMIIKIMAHLKGLPLEFGRREAKAFFKERTPRKRKRHQM